MINQKKVLVVIPARGGSKGLPGKNIRPLQGLPLVAWPIKAALSSRYVDRVVVTTDCAHIAKIAQEYGADVPFLRPAHLAEDSSPSSGAIIHALDFCAVQDGEYDYIVLLEPTSPLTESLDIDRALETLVASQATSIVGVCKAGTCHPLYCATIDSEHTLKPYGRDRFTKPIRRQDMDDVYFFEGSLYIAEVKKYREVETFYHEPVLPYVVPDWKALEIDTLFDFLMIETLLKNKELLNEF